MRRFLLLFSMLLTAVAAVPVPAVAQVGARIWVDNEPEYFRRGDRMNVSFSVSDDSYVAIVHVDTEGNLDFVYPASPWDNEFVRGGVVQLVSARGTSAWTVRGRAGIGYFYLIASPDPLDFTYFRGRMGSPWEWGYAGQGVRGDPFLALDQIARLLLPSPYARYVYDYYSYYVDGIHQYPSYACSSQYYDYGWGMYPSYGSCNQMNYFLRDNPYYYDTQRYRGDRRQYLRQYDNLDPRHGFKESPDRPAQGIRPSNSGSGFQGSAGQIPRREPVAADPAPQTQTQGRAPARGVPSTQTRPAPQARPSAEPRSASPSGSRDRPTPSAGPRREPASGGSSQAAPSSERAPARGRPAP